MVLGPLLSWRIPPEICGEIRDAVASLCPTAEEARIISAIVDAAAKVRDLNFKYMAEGKGATVTARFGPDDIARCNPNLGLESADKMGHRISRRRLVLLACRSHRLSGTDPLIPSLWRQRGIALTQSHLTKAGS